MNFVIFMAAQRSHCNSAPKDRRTNCLAFELQTDEPIGECFVSRIA